MGRRADTVIVLLCMLATVTYLIARPNNNADQFERKERGMQDDLSEDQLESDIEDLKTRLRSIKNGGMESGLSNDKVDDTVVEGLEMQLQEIGMQGGISFEQLESEVQDLKKQLLSIKEKEFRGGVAIDQLKSEVKDLKTQLGYKKEKEIQGSVDVDQLKSEVKDVKTQTYNEGDGFPKTREAIREALWAETELMLKSQKSSKRLPDIIGLGVKKCGTYAFDYFTSRHPLINWHYPHEAHFFNKFDITPKTVENYRKSFDEVKESVLVGDNTPAYFRTYGSMEKIQDLLPNAKVFVILCDPAARVISDYKNMLESFNREGKDQSKLPPNMEYALTKSIFMFEEKYNVSVSLDVSNQLLQENEAKVTGVPSNGIITDGFYDHLIFKWLQHYNSSNFFIVDAGILLKDPGRIVEEFHEFVGLPKLILREDFVPDANKPGFFCYKDHRSGAKSCMPDHKSRTRNGQTTTSQALIDRLRILYKPHKERLEAMLGRTFEWGW